MRRPNSSLAFTITMLIVGAVSTAFAFQRNEGASSDTAEGREVYTPPPAEQSGVVGLPERVVYELGNPRLHQPHVRDVTFTPDGKYLVSSGQHFNSDSVIRVWDVATGKPVQRLFLRKGGNVDSLTGFVLTPDGKQLIAGFYDGVIGVWDLESGDPVAGLQRHRGSVNALAVSPDGKLLATAGGEGTIVISTLDRLDEPLGTYVTGDYTPEYAIFTDEFSATTMAFTPDGKHLVAGVSKGKAVVKPQPDGKDPPKLVPVGTDMANEVVILRASDAKHVRTLARVDDGYDGDLDGDEIDSVAVSPDGKQILVGRMNRIPRKVVPDRIVSLLDRLCIAEIQMWDFETGELIRDLRKDDFDHSFGNSTLSPDGKIVALGEFGAVHLIDAGTGESIRKIPVDGWRVRNAAFSPDGRLIAAAIDSEIRLWEVKTGKRLFDEEPGHARLVGRVDYSADGKLIATAGRNQFHVWDAHTGKHVFTRTFGPDGSVLRIRFSRDGQRLAVAGMVQDQIGWPMAAVSIWKSTGDLWNSIRLDGQVLGIAFSPDGERLAIAHDFFGVGTRLELWNADSEPYRITEFPRGDRKWISHFHAMKFSPDGRYVLLAEQNGTITKWDTTEAEEANSFLADWRPEDNPSKALNRPPGLNSAEFTSDGKHVVCTYYGSADIYVWDIESGNMTSTIELPYETCSHRLKLAPDDRTVAVSREYCEEDYHDKTLQLYDLTTGKKLLALQPNDDEALSMAFSPDMTRLVTGLYRGTALVWDLRPKR